MAKPIVYGPAYSTFVRTVRMALEDKAADYDLVEVDIFSGAVKEPAHIARHPFGKVPAFEHDGLMLYETDAITRYVNEAFEGPDLEPADIRDRALMNQVIGVINCYAYPCMVGQIFIQRAVMPMLGNDSDEAAIDAAIPEAQKCIAVLEQAIGDKTYLAGDGFSRADLLLIPVYDYLSQTPEGARLLEAAPKLNRWWDRVAARPSVEKTRPSFD
jgi:glutathione S-transferase